MTNDFPLRQNLTVKYFTLKNEKGLMLGLGWFKVY